jgi:hypothetical protein
MIPRKKLDVQEARLSQQQDALDARSEALEEEVECLNKESERVGDLIIDADRIISCHLQIIGQQECLAICDALHTSLPLELREMVYAYALGGVFEHYTVHPTSPDWMCSVEFPCFRKHTCEKGACGLHFWNAKYMGTDVRREMIESWYRTSVFEFATPMPDLPCFLLSDTWNIGQHAYSLITHVRLRFDIEAKNSAECERIESLHLLKEHSKVTICLEYDEFTSAVDVYSRCETTITKLWPSISKLTSLRFSFLLPPEEDNIILQVGRDSLEGWLVKLKALLNPS